MDKALSAHAPQMLALPIYLYNISQIEAQKIDRGQVWKDADEAWPQNHKVPRPCQASLHRNTWYGLLSLSRA